MADEPQATPTVDDIESPDFDWGRFFAADAEPEAAPVAAPVAAAVEEPEEELTDNEAVALRKQVEELKQMVSETAKTTTEIATKNRVITAVEAWKQQATPAELAMADVLADSTSLEDLQAKATLVKRVAQGADKVLESEKQKIERDLQRQFGLPVTPSFQPIPDQEKMQTALEAGDIDQAAALAVKGLFNT